MKWEMQRYDLLKKQCMPDGYLKPKIVHAHHAEPTREEVEHLKERASNCLCTYSPSEAKLRVDALLLKAVCTLALKVKPKRFKLRIKHEKKNYKNRN